MVFIPVGWPIRGFQNYGSYARGAKGCAASSQLILRSERLRIVPPRSEDCIVTLLVARFL